MISSQILWSKIILHQNQKPHKKRQALTLHSATGASVEFATGYKGVKVSGGKGTACYLKIYGNEACKTQVASIGPINSISMFAFLLEGEKGSRRRGWLYIVDLGGCISFYRLCPVAAISGKIIGCWIRMRRKSRERALWDTELGDSNWYSVRHMRWLFYC